MPIVSLAASMTDIRYIGPIRRVLNYEHRAAICIVCTKFHQDSFEAERIVGVATDR